MSNNGVGGVKTTPPEGSAIGIVRIWLMRSPRPSSLRVYAKDGREFDIEITPGAAWVDTASSVCALEPERIEALSSDGKLLRACVVSDLVKKEETQASQQAATFTAMQSSDPETQRLIVFAELISRAHERSTQAIENTIGIAFTQLQEICNGLAVQANAAQQSANELSVAIRNMMIQQAEDAREEATQKQESPLEQMAAHFLTGAQAAEAAKEQPKPNGKPNGHR